MKTVSCAAALAALVPALSIAHAAGVCAQYQTTVFAAYQAQTPITDGRTQHPLNGWQYRRSDTGGLLSGVTSTSWTGGAWGCPDLTYYVPLCGPLYSPDAGINQNPYARRPPTFNGIMFHPGFSNREVQAVLAPQTPQFISAFSVTVEHLGTASPDVYISVQLIRASGTTTLIAPTQILSLAPARTLTVPSSLLSFTLSPGDRIVVSGNAGNIADEDWVNMNASATLCGSPLITTQPEGRFECVGRPISFHVDAAGAATYQWQRNGVNLTPAPGRTGTNTATLTLSAPIEDAVGAYRCIISNPNGSTTSAPAGLSLNSADFNGDGDIGTDQDIEAFFRCLAGTCCALCGTADFNADGDIGTDGDIEAFFRVLAGGAC